MVLGLGIMLFSSQIDNPVVLLILRSLKKIGGLEVDEPVWIVHMLIYVEHFGDDSSLFSSISRAHRKALYCMGRNFYFPRYRAAGTVIS